MNAIEHQMKTLRMPSMAQCWTSLMETRRHAELSLEDGLKFLLQAEQDGRLASRQARLVQQSLLWLQIYPARCWQRFVKRTAYNRFVHTPKNCRSPMNPLSVSSW